MVTVVDFFPTFVKNLSDFFDNFCFFLGGVTDRPCLPLRVGEIGDSE